MLGILNLGRPGVQYYQSKRVALVKIGVVVVVWLVELSRPGFEPRSWCTAKSWPTRAQDSECGKAPSQVELGAKPDRSLI